MINAHTLQTGSFASSCASLRVGVGRAVGLSLALVLALSALALVAAPAVAASPEPPEALAPTEVKATGASLHGILDPGKEGVPGTFELGTYQFLYKASKTKECKGGSVAPVPQGTSLGGGKEELPSEPVAGLAANTEYAVCLQFETAGGKAVSPAVAFKTALPPEKPVTITPAKAITGITAKLEGTLNPVKVGEAGTYEFTYQRSATECNREFGAPEPAGTMTGTAKQAVSVTATGLEPLREYTFCLVATNKAGESASGSPVSFETLAAPPALSLSAPEVQPTEARLEAVVNPNNEPTGCRVQYGEHTISEHELPCIPETLSGFGNQGTSVRLKGLTQKTIYHYRVTAENAQSKIEDKPVTAEATFTTTSPERPEVKAATEVTATSAVLNGVLNPRVPGEAGSYEFVYRHSAVGACKGEGEQTTASVPALGGKEEPAGPTKVEGLSPGTQYAFCVRAHAEGEAVSSPLTFTTPPLAPTIEAESEAASEVSATGAKLVATIIPGGPESPYHVTIEYGPSASYGLSVSLPEQEAGYGVSEVHIQQQLQDLQSQTTYHYRFVIANAAAPAGVAGADETFTTESSGAPFVLPDNRAYEMVTPVQKQGALFKGLGGEHPIRAASSGDAIADIASVPTEDAPEGNGTTLVPVLSTRGGSGWSSRAIAAPHPATGPAREELDETLFFSEDLSSDVVFPVSPGFEKLSPQASEPTPYLHTLFLNGNPSEPCQALYTEAKSCFAPLVSASDDTDVPLQPFGELDAAGECEGAKTFQCGPLVRAATPDLSHVVLSSSVPLTEASAPIGVIVGSGREAQPDLYEFTAGRLQLLSILPSQQKGSLHLGLAGRPPLEGREGFTGKEDLAARHAISDDGGRVVLDEFNEEARGRHTALYLRDVTKGETIRLDEPSGEEGTEASVEPEYMDANSEDSRIFFLDSAKLTANSGATHGAPGQYEEDKPDLYECQIVEEAGHDTCKLTDLTPKTEGGESASVALVLGVSEDGSYVYFAAGGGLGIAPPEPEPGGCTIPADLGEQPPESAICNVYVRHDGVTQFVAGLSQQDQGDWATDDLTGNPVRVSPNGSWLAFLSQRSLTGFDARSAATGQPASEVYLYHAPSDLDDEAGTLSCASCDPTGSRPAGGASVPGWTGSLNGEAYYQPRYLSDEGRLFFDSPDALVPLDVSKQSEVYEYEPQRVPQTAPEAARCGPGAASGSEVFEAEHEYEVEARKGRAAAACVALISTGTAAEGSQFLEASETGTDVFFLTTEKVLPQDTDTAPDVYDAHECTTGSPCISQAAAPPPCDDESSCKAPPTPQPTIYGAPASATFSGPGNLIPFPPPLPPKPKTAAQIKAERLASALKACKKDKSKKKRVSCEKQARKRYGAKASARKSAKRATSDRRASR